jgi:glycine cleavage system H protein
VTPEGPASVPYRREQFEIRLPADRLYSPSHVWLAKDETGAWRVGFTPFAVRMLGEPVELAVTAAPGSAVAVGQVVGWVEGFKAVTDVYSVVDGGFGGGNPDLAADITFLRTDPFGRGWLYRATGTPAPDCTDARGYVGVLDRTIERLEPPAAGGERC